MMKFANVNAWMRRISLMLQKEEEMKAPGTTWYQDLLVTHHNSSNSSTPEDNDTGMPQDMHSSSRGNGNGNGNGNGHHNVLEHKSQLGQRRQPMDPAKKLGKIWDQWNCNLHLRRISEISRGSAACRLVDQHVHRRLTHHMLRHIVEVGRALPNDMEKSLYLEELMPPPVAILPPDEQDASDSNMRWSLVANDTMATASSSSSSSSSGNNNHNVYIPKRLKDATYADLLHISTSRAKNNPKRIAANATAAAEDRRALDPSKTIASSSKDNHTKNKNLPGKKKPRPTTNHKTSNHNIAAAALATSAFANMLVSSGTKVKESADVIDALESAEHQLQCDAFKRGFVGKFTIHDIRSQMILFLDEIMVGMDPLDQIGIYYGYHPVNICFMMSMASNLLPINRKIE